MDLIIDKLAASFQNKHPIVRLGHSSVREDLNERYSLETARKNDAVAYERVQKRMESAKILITATFSLR